MKIYALIPARSGSKGLPNKNVLKCNHHPLLGHAIAFAKKCPVDRIFVSTDSESYRRIALEYGAEVPWLRSPGAATDMASEDDILMDVTKMMVNQNIPLPDIWVWLKPTSPFRSVGKVKEAINALRLYHKFDSVRIVSEADARLQKVNDRTGYLEPLLSVWPEGRSKVRRTEFPDVYSPFNLEVFRHSGWRDRGADFMGKNIHPIVDHAVTGIDIDGKEDFEIAKAVIESRSPDLMEYIHL